MSKSPVFGMGRNRNHRPPRSPFHASAANINMHGKKTKRMSCSCCTAIDLRDNILRKIHLAESKKND
jgi:hypothetical protein